MQEEFFRENLGDFRDFFYIDKINDKFYEVAAKYIFQTHKDYENKYFSADFIIYPKTKLFYCDYEVNIENGLLFNFKFNNNHNLFNIEKAEFYIKLNVKLMNKIELEEIHKQILKEQNPNDNENSIYQKLTKLKWYEDTKSWPNQLHVKDNRLIELEKYFSKDTTKMEREKRFRQHCNSALTKIAFDQTRENVFDVFGSRVVEKQQEIQKVKQDDKLMYPNNRIKHKWGMMFRHESLLDDLAELQSNLNSKFILDSGASIHVFNNMNCIDKLILQSIEEIQMNSKTMNNTRYQLNGISGGPMMATHRGFIQGLGEFLVVPEAKQNLISIPTLMGLEIYEISFTNKNCCIRYIDSEQYLLECTISKNNLFIIDSDQLSELSTIEKISQEAFHVKIHNKPFELNTLKPRAEINDASKNEIFSKKQINRAKQVRVLAQ
jgi:hypothetical protein